VKTKSGLGKYFVGFFILVIVSFATDINLWILLGISSAPFLTLEIYSYIYFKSEKFSILKESINNHIQNCNDLNNHIEELKNTYLDVQNVTYGSVRTIDNSNYNFRRSEWKNLHRSNQVYNCSLSICRNAANDPFKYLCKYFNIETTEKTLDRFSEVLNNFSSAEEGKNLLMKERNEILDSISNQIPRLIDEFYNQRLIDKLGFHQVDLSTSYFPTFTFQYVSSGGNSSLKSNIIFDINNLNEFIQFLSKKIDYLNSTQGQRSLMTSGLRTFIKKRDEYKCCTCRNGIENEPNLLLEIDHIVPISKGGLTNEENLQTLCWRCNRSKGSKILVEI
jgi:hypothetical protein